MNANKKRHPNNVTASTSDVIFFVNK